MPVDELVTLRRELHEHPELSHNEKETSRRVRHFIDRYPPDHIIDKLGGHGLLLTYQGRQPGPVIMFRADMDALPIAEEGQAPYRSTSPGVAHSCGHDGHMSILAGLARELSLQRPGRGTVHLLFQGAEETGEGARKVLDDSRFATVKPDYVFALHNLPGFPLGHVVVKDGPFSAAVTSLVIQLEGKESHAAEPEEGINPAACIADILQTFQEIERPDPSLPGFCLITPVYGRFGEMAYGTSAGQGEVHFTVRAWSQETLDGFKLDLPDITAGLASEHRLRLKTSFIQDFKANINHPEANRFVREATGSLGMPLVERDLPFRWGEDFGLFTQSFKGAMFGLGSGMDQPALHNPDYDFPDELIPLGVKLFHALVAHIQKGEGA